MSKETHTSNVNRQTINSTIWRYYIFSFLKGCAFFSAVLIPFFTEWGHISMTRVAF
ncbi:MAG TPA: hypothetical protein VJB65_04700 [Patescibacteria group bacterium]|nr:hypothetical protein [Patescibacteria group bacterium]